MKHYRVLLLAVGSVLGVGIAAPEVGAQAKVEFTYRMAPGQPEIKVKLSAIHLRPNADHQIELFVKNLEEDKTEDALKGVVVKLMRVDVKPPAQVAKATLEKLDDVPPDSLPPGMKARLVIDPKTMAWSGEAGKLKLRFEAQNQKAVEQDIEFKLDLPNKYLKLGKTHYDPANRRISFAVSLKKEFVGPPCPVELMLEPDYIPGLKSIKNKKLKWDLSTIGEELTLYAELEFAGPASVPADPRVFLSVDGFDRAFEFRPNFSDPLGAIRSVEYANDVAVRVRAKRYQLPDKKNPLAVTLEIDSTDIDQPALVKLGFNPSEDMGGVYQIQKLASGGELRGLRDIKLNLSAGKSGELAAKMSVADWKVTVPTVDVLGRCWLRAGVFEADGKTEKKVSPEALKPLEAGRAGLAPLILEKNHVYVPVTYDDSTLEAVKFKNLPAEVGANEDYEVQVVTEDRSDPRYAPVEKAIIYLGKKSDDKIDSTEKKEAVLKSGVWTATLRMPEKEGKYEVAVQFELANKLKSSDSDFVIVKVVPPEKILATLKGKIVDVADRALEGAVVKLKDAKGEVVDEQRSGEGGAFAFEKLPPGAYVLEARRAIPSLAGQSKVVVPPGKKVVEKNVQLKMK